MYVFIGFVTSEKLIPLSVYNDLFVSAAFYLESILSDSSIATPTVFWLPFAWNMVSHPFTFKLFVSLDLNRL